MAEPTMPIINSFRSYPKCKFIFFSFILSHRSNSFGNPHSQKRMMVEVRPFLEDSIKDAFSSEIPSCVKIADLGCSSGPNALLAIPKIIHTIHGMSKGMNCKSSEFQVFLNDLLGNGFNNIFSSLPNFYEKLKKEVGGKMGHCFITGVPGSFYTRIFKSRSLDFVHSSCSLHWLSQVQLIYSLFPFTFKHSPSIF